MELACAMGAITSAIKNVRFANWTWTVLNCVGEQDFVIPASINARKRARCVSSKFLWAKYIGEPAFVIRAIAKLLLPVSCVMRNLVQTIITARAYVILVTTSVIRLVGVAGRLLISGSCIGAQDYVIDVTCLQKDAM